MLIQELSIGKCETIKTFLRTKNNLECEVDLWLKKYQIIPIEAKLLFYNENNWEYKGSESYMSSVSLKYSLYHKEYDKNIIFKALTTINPIKSLLDWNRRRNILKTNNIPVSKWYFSENAIIVEDFYENDYSSIRNLNVLKVIAIKLDNLGFTCLNYLQDIRCDKRGNPYYIDFGFDLGEPSMTKSNRCQTTFNNYKIQLNKNGKNTSTY